MVVASDLSSPLTTALDWLHDRLSGVPEVYVDDSRHRGASISDCSPARPTRVSGIDLSRHAAESVAIGVVASSFPASDCRITLS